MAQIDEATPNAGRFPRSDALGTRSSRVIPLATQTLSKSATQWMQGSVPMFMERGSGSHLWDLDGNEWVDFPMALGPVLLGYSNSRVDDAIRAQIRDGYVFTLNHPLEVEVAERIVESVPGVEAVRFGKSGSDALSAAVRAARARTGRSHVLTCGYHGWHDWYIGVTSRHAGIPDVVRDLVSSFAFNDIDSLKAMLEAHEGQVAAVVLEPAGADVPAPGFLQGVVDLAHHHGALVVFDEVITGFRLAVGGAVERYGVDPDLVCYGKALGNGMPVSAVAGPWRVMEVFEEIFFSGTHGGEVLSLAAARAVLDTIEDGSVLASIETLGTRLRSAFDEIVSRYGMGTRVRVGGEPQRTVVTFPGDNDQLLRSWVQQCMAEQRILFNGSMFISAAHSDEDIDRAIVSFECALKAAAEDHDLGSRLTAAPLQTVFRPV